MDAWQPKPHSRRRELQRRRTRAGRRQATQLIVTRYEHIPQLDVPLETAELILGFVD